MRKLPIGSRLVFPPSIVPGILTPYFPSGTRDTDSISETAEPAFSPLSTAPGDMKGRSESRLGFPVRAGIADPTIGSYLEQPRPPAQKPLALAGLCLQLGRPAFIGTRLYFLAAPMLRANVSCFVPALCSIPMGRFAEFGTDKTVFRHFSSLGFGPGVMSPTGSNFHTSPTDKTPSPDD